MPPGVRVFVSHSSAENDLARQAIDALRRHLNADITLLYDKDVLDTGEHWRDELWQWWSYCDAAVIVCSKAALTSRWMLIEVALMMRRHVTAELPVFPIVIDPATVEEMRTTSWFRDQLLPELQVSHVWTAANLDTEAQALAAKINALAILSPLQKPLFDWEERMAVILQKYATTELVTKAAQILQARVEAWMSPSLVARIVGRALVEAKRDVVKQAMKCLAKAIDEAQRTEMMELIAAAWLPVEDVAPIASIIDRPHGRRGVALPWPTPPLARWYIRRASARYPEWRPVEFKRPIGADDLEEVYDSVVTSLRAHLKLDADDAEELILARLRTKEAAREPVFILVPVDASEPPKSFASRMLVPLIERLTHDFRSLSFFVLAGRPPVSLDDAVNSGRLVFLPIDTQSAIAWIDDYGEAISATG